MNTRMLFVKVTVAIPVRVTLVAAEHTSYQPAAAWISVVGQLHVF
jgi:hypothetical protein